MFPRLSTLCADAVAVSVIPALLMTGAPGNATATPRPLPAVPIPRLRLS